MGRDTKRIYSIGRAKESADVADGDPFDADGSALRDDDDRTVPAAGESAVHPTGTAELLPVIDVGDPAEDRSAPPPEEADEAVVTREIAPEALKPKPVSLPRQEKPVPLTREIGASPHRSTGPLGTIRVSPIEMVAGPSADSAEAVPSSASRRRAARRCPTCGTHFSGPEVRFCPFDGSPVDNVPDWDPSGDPLIGKTLLDRFTVESVLAEGSMGTVYRVRHQRLDARFAMKVLRRDLARESEIATRIIDEARATAAIGHPNIVAVSDFGEISASELPDLGELKLPFFVMELLEGSSLADVIRNEAPLPPERIARIMTQCASALAAAHGTAIVHRDLKPANIRLSRSELGEEMVKVVDFGVSKIMGLSRKTRPGIVFGTPHYMSPEQGKGLEIDHRTDIYALGVIMYECVTGKVPFEADTYMGVVTKHLFTRPEPIEFPPADLCGSALELIITRCLAKDRADRYGAMSEVANDLERAIRGELPADAHLAHAAQLELRERETPPSSRPPLRSSGAAIPIRNVPRGLVIVVTAIAAAAAIVVALSLAGQLPMGADEPPEIQGSATEETETGHTSTAGSEPAPQAGPTAEADAPAEPPAATSSTPSPEARLSPPTPSPLPLPPPTARPSPPKPTTAADEPPQRPSRPPERPQPGGDVVDPWSK